MFGRSPKWQPAAYDKTGKVPIIRASICNGDKVAGFKDLATGHFEEIMAVRNDKDLEEFMQRYGVKREEIRKEW